MGWSLQNTTHKIVHLDCQDVFNKAENAESKMMRITNITQNIYHNSLHKHPSGEWYHVLSASISISLDVNPKPDGVYRIDMTFETGEGYYQGDLNAPTSEIDKDQIEINLHTEEVYVDGMEEPFKLLWEQWRDGEEIPKKLQEKFQKMEDAIDTFNLELREMEEMEFEVDEEGILLSRELPLGYLKEGVELSEINSRNFTSYLKEDYGEFEWSMCVDW